MIASGAGISGRKESNHVSRKKKDLDGFSSTSPQNVSQPFDPVILVYTLSHVDPKVNLFTFFLEL